MGARPAGGVSVDVLLRLGRVSNLPTVWSNLAAGAAVCGADLGVLALLLPAGTLFYTAGMFLNDAFDRRIDAVERPERPIPSGQVTAGAVFAMGGAMMAAGLALVAPLGPEPALAALVLCGCILAYDWHHKGNPFSPLVMGACRALLYVLVFATAPAPAAGWAVPAVALLAHVAGLTYAARQENMAEFHDAWPLLMLAVPVAVVAAGADGPSAPFVLLFAGWLAHGLRLLLVRRVRDPRRAVGAMIAAISLFDACLIAEAGHPLPALAAVAAFGLTLGLHRRVAGT
ncbi:MAG: UbiA family prenyltransferase [Actinomycetota bacterium]